MAVLAHGRLLAVGTPQDLAAQLHRGHRIRVEVDRAQAERAIALLQATPPVTLAEPVADHGGERNGGVALSVHGVGRSAVPHIVSALAGAGIDLYRVEPDEPSLEDVYFALQEVNP